MIAWLTAVSVAPIAACGGIDASHRAGPLPKPPTTAEPATTAARSGRPIDRRASSPATTEGLPASAPCTGGKPPSRVAHVVWIWMENHRYDQVIGNPDAPFTTTLAKACATATHYRAVGRPSLPNYLAATSGSTYGITDDAPPAVHPIQSDNLFRQVRRRGGAARTYAEAMPAPCALFSAGRYAVKHNPATYYVGADDRTACRHDDLPLGTDAAELRRDLATGQLPMFLLVVPDTCHDTHDCPVGVGDRWLASLVGRLTASTAYRAGDTVLFVVWDEPTPMPFVAVAPWIPSGTVLNREVDHFALLRTTEELLGIPALLGAARGATSMTPLLGL